MRLASNCARSFLSLCLERKENFHCNKVIRSLSLETLLLSLLCKQILLLSKYLKDMKTTTKNNDLNLKI